MIDLSDTRIPARARPATSQQSPPTTRPPSTTGPLSTDDAVALLHAHWAPLHALAVSVLRDAHGAQDAVQDTLVAIIRRGVVFDDADGALRYARTAVLNHCRSALRRAATARGYLRLVRREETAAPADEAVLRTESATQVLALFDRLPLRQREVLILRYLHHLDNDEIAATLAISSSTVRSAASRALSTLSRLLEGTPS